MNKIGIITLYYKNDNYGGVAQAYALNKYLSNLGLNSELITYKKEKNNLKLTTKNKSARIILKRARKKIINMILKEPIEKICNKKYEIELQKRKEKLENFRNNIKHSELYDIRNIRQIEGKYDYYVTGSDQTWNPGCVDDAFVFNFLNENDKIISYASSVAVEEFSENYKNFMTNALKKYNYISVREEKSKEKLQEITAKNIEWVVDPTMLIDKKEWNQLSNKRVIKEKYIFSYILGDSIKQRNKVKKFAKKMGLKLVTIPFIKNGCNFKYKIEDFKYGDYQMIDISFEDFLSLIKYAEYVITDSFHAVSFSYIFEKDFFVINRSSVISTNSRIESILKIFQLEDRLIKHGEIPMDTKTIDYSRVNENSKYMINKSKEFLNKALEIK